MLTFILDLVNEASGTLIMEARTGPLNILAFSTVPYLIQYKVYCAYFLKFEGLMSQLLNPMSIDSKEDLVSAPMSAELPIADYQDRPAEELFERIVVA
jgi:hypothetical protein